ncbi:MAG: multicopper oxidase domain-containing protein [Acidobacteria bacterium]|nr:multicopper oxidase domain-containing protein [Acidobacteriota bacterium]
MKGKKTPDISQHQRNEPGTDSEPSGSKTSDSKQPSGIGRRGFLAAGLSAAAAITALPQLVGAQQKPKKKRTTTAQSARGIIVGQPQFTLLTFPQPFEYRSCGGLLDLPLTVGMIGSAPNQVRVYNGNLPGPTLRLQANDTLKLMMINQLPGNPPPPNPGASNLDYCNQPNAMSNPHCFNSTNLHTHGLHVSPGSVGSQASDDVLITIAPGKQQKYCIEIPSFHAPGTHWYHAHMHGSTAFQLVNGLCGALIIDEPVGQQIYPTAHKDYVWIIQEIIPGGDAQTIYSQAGASTTKFYVNGKDTPNLYMSLNEVQRWRFINATGTPRGYSKIVFLNSNNVAQNMSLVAMDGISFYGKSPQVVQSVLLGGGNRADVFIKPLAAGTYTVVRQSPPSGGPGNPDQVLATVHVSATNANMSLPTTIPGVAPAYLQPISNPVANARQANLGTIQPGNSWTSKCPNNQQPAAHPSPILPGMNVVNCREYVMPPAPDAPPDPAWDQFIVNLNAKEQWVLKNVGGAAHPFHIHVNPFQVEHMKIDPNGPDNETNWMFLDTIPLITSGQPWVNNNGEIRIRTRYADYYGRFVMHCHILVHEDLGLMANVYVNGNGGGTGPCVKI